MPLKIIVVFAGFPVQSGEGVFHHISVMGDKVLVTDEIFPVCRSSCLITS